MAVRILHCHSTFALGGKEARAVRLMNAFGDAAEHVVLSAMPDQLGARDGDRRSGIAVAFPGRRAAADRARRRRARLLRLSRYMRGFDLVLTYNWGAFDAVMARRLFGGPPLVHHEDGFNEDEARAAEAAAQPLPPARPAGAPTGWSCRRRGSSGSRRKRLGAAARAGRADRQRHRRSRAFARPPEPDAIPGFERRPGEVVIGTVAGLRAVKNLPRLVRAFAAHAPQGRRGW